MTSIFVLVTLVSAACGGRANKDEGAAASKVQADEQPAVQQEPAGQQSAPAPQSDVPAAESTGGAQVPTPAASGSQKSATPKQAQGASTPAAGAASGTGSGGSAAPKQAAGQAAAPKDSSGVPAAPAATAPGGGGSHTGPATLSPVNVGTICECSGPTGASIGPGIASNQLVVKWINDNGGLNGHPVKLFVGESNSDPNRYFALLKQMVEENKVIAFLGQMSPLTINAGDKYLREKGIPVVGGDGAHGLWFQSPVLFFPGPSYITQAVATAKLAVALGTPKIAMFYCAEAQPCQVGRDALHSKLKDEKAPTAEIVYEAKVSLAQPDFSAECLQAKSKGAQAVIVFVDAAAASRATRSCIQQSFRPQWLASPLTSASADDPNNDGMINPVAVFPWFLEQTPAQRL
ncbi:MAG TPA: ABC transporter substrate-binding protein, partial [Acidimicrobiia bacterium]|nr:ABC transporter substrate-binding protein [Acidimicrobiia bacterium]